MDWEMQTTLMNARIVSSADGAYLKSIFYPSDPQSEFRSDCNHSRIGRSSLWTQRTSESQEYQLSRNR